MYSLMSLVTTSNLFRWCIRKHLSDQCIEYMAETMSKQTTPIVQILAYAQEYAFRYSPTRRDVSWAEIEIDFVNSCVNKFASGYGGRSDMFSRLLRSLENAETNMITRGDVTRWGLVDATGLNRMFDSHSDDCTIRYLYFRHLGMTGIYSIALVISWVEAIYAGLQLLRTSLELLDARICRDNVLQTLSEFNSNTCMSDQEDSDLDESLDFSSCRIDVDYLII